MQNKRSLQTFATVLGLSALLPLSALAQGSVTRIDDDTLRVIEYRGKPPHKRLIIDRDNSPELFAQYVERIDYDPQPLLLSERRGAPGKSLPRQVLRVTGDPGEIAEFARFEESADNSNDARAWRGAPGKGRRLSR